MSCIAFRFYRCLPTLGSIRSASNQILGVRHTSRMMSAFLLILLQKKQQNSNNILIRSYIFWMRRISGSCNCSKGNQILSCENIFIIRQCRGTDRALNGGTRGYLDWSPGNRTGVKEPFKTVLIWSFFIKMTKLELLTIKLNYSRINING